MIEKNKARLKESFIHNVKKLCLYTAMFCITIMVLSYAVFSFVLKIDDSMKNTIKFTTIFTVLFFFVTFMQLFIIYCMNKKSIGRMKTEDHVVIDKYKHNRSYVIKLDDEGEYKIDKKLFLEIKTGDSVDVLKGTCLQFIFKN